MPVSPTITNRSSALTDIEQKRIDHSLESLAKRLANFPNPSIDLTLDDANKTVVMAPTEAGPKDDHWYDVQTKFDLAKAYQEMGDKDGAREILQEVIKEGDTGQQGEAKKLLDALG